MKKKLFALLMTAILAMVALAGCGSSTGDETGTDVSSPEDEIVTEYYYSVEISGLDEAVLAITFTDESGETYVEETGSYGWFGTPDMTIGEMMAEWNIVSIEPKLDEYDFLGWKAYEMVIEVDENGLENYVQNPLFEGKLFSTEEMMVQELFDTDITFYTVWDLVCGGCEQNKECTVYYIDDGRYFVCDDCYEEFAHGMGLE